MKDNKKTNYVEGAIIDKDKPLPQIQEDKKKKENEELRKIFKGDRK